MYNRSVQRSDGALALLRIGYCPLLEAWRGDGATPDELVELCDIACEGDYGMVAEKLILSFDQRLADGSDNCIIRVVPRN
jgi:hypothetical protein